MKIDGRVHDEGKDTQCIGGGCRLVFLLFFSHDPLAFAASSNPPDGYYGYQGRRLQRLATVLKRSPPVWLRIHPVSDPHWALSTMTQHEPHAVTIWDLDGLGGFIMVTYFTASSWQSVSPDGP